MPYVKLDNNILNSSLWSDHDARTIFITALLMARPIELREPTPTIKVAQLEPDDFVIPPGWYGMVDAASIGIIRQAGLNRAGGIEACERLAAPDPDSRSEDFDGRRMVRVDGGFIILNFQKYRDKDHTAAERQARWRERNKAKKETSNAVTLRNITQAEAEAEVHRGKDFPLEPPSCSKNPHFEAFWAKYRAHICASGKQRALDSFRKLSKTYTPAFLMERLDLFIPIEQARLTKSPLSTPLHASTWLNQKRFLDDLAEQPINHAAPRPLAPDESW